MSEKVYVLFRGLMRNEKNVTFLTSDGKKDFAKSGLRIMDNATVQVQLDKGDWEDAIFNPTDSTSPYYMIRFKSDNQERAASGRIFLVDKVNMVKEK